MLMTDQLGHRTQENSMDNLAFYEKLEMAKGPEDIILQKKLQTHALDEEARKIYEQLEVLKDDKLSYADEQRRLNNWRRCMVNFTHMLSQTFNRYRQGRGTVNKQADVLPLMEKLNILAQIPSEEKEKKLVIRHRGVQLYYNDLSDQEEENISETDYVISVGNCVIDLPFLTYLINTKILHDPDLIENLNKAFKFFSLSRIFIVEITLNDWSEDDRRGAENSLMHLANYFEKINRDDPNIIYNDSKLPDPNLTMLCAMSKLPPASFQGLVHSVTLKMSDNMTKKKFADAHSIYDALFMINNIKTRLVRPKVEINNNTCIQMWRHCFDGNGRFNRAQFNRFQPQFKKWEQAFYFFWNDLKAVTNENDRTIILNCLIKFMKDSRHIYLYIEHLLKDFFYYPLNLQVSDLNSLIFTNMLLFKNFANQSYDFGRTPEEVLNSSQEKNYDLIDKLNYSMDKGWGDRFHEKMKTIERNLDLALESNNDESAGLSSKFLISINRELLFFLTLIGAQMVNRVLAIALEEYGDPQSSFYHAKNSSSNMKDLLQYLQVAIRCQGMIKEKKNLELLEDIKDRRHQFISLKTGLLENTAMHKKLINNVMTIAEETIGGMSTPQFSQIKAAIKAVA